MVVELFGFDRISLPFGKVRRNVIEAFRNVFRFDGFFRWWCIRRVHTLDREFFLSCLVYFFLILRQPI